MRDSNYRSITANRAAVTISTTLYDRRALDCTSDKPLVNSLNHLTFLASSSGKVRETLSNDGGLERLVDILYECKLDENSQNLDDNPLVAWKWSLAFQCLVLVGTRGTEAIRKKVVDAGMIPVIATVLDNYLAINANNGSGSGTSFGHQYTFGADGFTENNQQAHNAFSEPPVSREDEIVDINGAMDTDSVSANNTAASTTTSSTATGSTTAASAASAADDLIDGLSAYRKKNKQIHFWPDHIEQLKKKMELMHNIVHLTTSVGYASQEDDFSANKLFIDYIEDENFILDATKGKYAKYKKNRRQLVDLTAPRNFINGILVPREDDVLWSLQLLAFISKYSYLKPILSETNIISGMSLRSPPPQEDLLSFNGNFSNSVPALENDDVDNDNELEEIRSVENDKKDDCDDEIMIDTEGENNNNNHNRDVSENNSNNEASLANKLDLMLPLSLNLNLNNREDSISPAASVICAESSNFDKLNAAVKSLEFTDDRLAKAKGFVKMSKILNKDLKHESLRFKEFKIRHHQLESHYIKSKWNYATYPFFDNLNEDQDPSIKALQVLNIFPLVEKFTVKSSHSKEIHYWAGVIMRNSCRRDESKGGIRQCASFACGKWEASPRQFAKCRRCKRTKYCSKECQSTAWEYHRHWCVQTSSSSGTAPSITSTSAAAVPNTHNVMVDTTPRSFASATAAAEQYQDDNDSINSSVNTTTTANTVGFLRQAQQQPLVTSPLGAFISPAQLSLNNAQPFTGATTPQPALSSNNNDNSISNNNINHINNNNNNNNHISTPILAPANNRGINFGTIAFHNAVHATLAATNNSNNNNNRADNSSPLFNFGGFNNRIDSNNDNNNNNSNNNNTTGNNNNNSNNDSN